MNATVKIPEEVADVLRRSTVTGTLLTLPAGRMDNKLYAKVKRVLELAGGKWKTHKQGFVFDSDPSEKLALAVGTNSIVNEKKARQAFYTPPDVADWIANMADVRDRSVLEPSAGEGALAIACLKAGARSVHCIEMAETCRQTLNAIGCTSVEIGDFLTMSGERVERVVMNPPFTGGQYLKHIAHAMTWLQPGGKLFSIVPDVGPCPELADHAHTIKVFPAGTFKKSGTNIRTRLILIHG